MAGETRSPQLDKKGTQELLYRAAHDRINKILDQVREENKVPAYLFGEETLKRSADIILQTMLQEGLLAEQGVLTDGRKVTVMPLRWLVRFLERNPNFLSEIFNSYFIGAAGLEHDMPDFGENQSKLASKSDAMERFFGDLKLIGNYKELKDGAGNEKERVLENDYDRFMIYYAQDAIMK